MGKLVEYPIKTLFNGVSRQPHPVRLPSQFEEQDNCLPSVVTGGFEKRPATSHIAKLTALSSAQEYAFHVIDRDSSNRYGIVIGNSDLYVYNLLTGAAVTVNFPSGKAYLAASPHSYKVVSVADYTFIVDTTKTVTLAVAAGGVLSGTVQKFSALGAPAAAAGQIWKVTGDDASGFAAYYVLSDGTTWNETVAPALQNSFTASTMPHTLVLSGGAFTFAPATWSNRPVGDTNTVPVPDFVGKTISDIVFFRGRLGLLSGETVTLSQAGDVFNFWPDKAFQTLDTDPVIQTSQTNQVTVLRNATPFRKALFVTSDNVQFELAAAERLTQKTAAFDPTTAYPADAMTKPTAMGDQLYFAGSAQDKGVVYEYYYSGDTFSNTAADINKHCEGYLPNGVRKLSGSALVGRLFALPEDARNHLYVYTSFWDGLKKAQSAWTRYIFGDEESDAYIYGHAVVADKVYLLTARNSQVHLESFTVNTEANDALLGFAPLYDRRVTLTGTYDAGNNWTTWTTPYAHGDDVKIMLGGAFTNQGGKTISVTYPSSTTVRATGDYSAHAVYAGIEYEARAEFSKQFIRDENGSAIQTGRLQLKRFSVNYKDTGYFEVWVTPYARDTRVWTMSGRVLGDIATLIGGPTLIPLGSFKVKPRSRADTVKIEIVSSSPYPMVITSASWSGTYNNTVTQG